MHSWPECSSGSRSWSNRGIGTWSWRLSWCRRRLDVFYGGTIISLSGDEWVQKEGQKENRELHLVSNVSGNEQEGALLGAATDINKHVLIGSNEYKRDGKFRDSNRKKVRASSSVK